MQVVKIERDAVEITAEDWRALGTVLDGFRNVCTHFKNCGDCPMQKFCKDHEIPYEYFAKLIEYLDD